jgi:hypothetical protein
MQYSRVLDFLHENTFKKTISIKWKPAFLYATFGTAVCSMFPCFIPLPPWRLYFRPRHSTRDWCRPQPPILLKNTIVSSYRHNIFFSLGLKPFLRRLFSDTLISDTISSVLVSEVLIDLFLSLKKHYILWYPETRVNNTRSFYFESSDSSINFVWPEQSIATLNTELCFLVFNTPASYSGGSEFNSRPGDRLS